MLHWVLCKGIVTSGCSLGWCGGWGRRCWPREWVSNTGHSPFTSSHAFKPGQEGPGYHMAVLMTRAMSRSLYSSAKWLLAWAHEGRASGYGLSQEAGAGTHGKFLVHHCLLSSFHTKYDDLVWSYSETSGKWLLSVGIKAALELRHALSDIPEDSFKTEKHAWI